MPPRKKRKSGGKISPVKCTSSVTRKQNKKENEKKTNFTKNDRTQEIVLNETFVPLSSDERNNSARKSIKKKATKMLKKDKVGDEGILKADFIPLSAQPLKHCVPKLTDEDEASGTLEISEVPVTIVVDDNDTESICIDDRISSSDSDSESVNDSIQIVGETGKSFWKSSVQVSPSSSKRKVPLSHGKKRKIDDSIEIVEMIDSLSDRPGKRAKIDKRLENTFVISNSDDEAPKCLDQDDDIVIVETLDNDSRDSIKVMNDFIPLKMSSALTRETSRRKKNFVKGNQKHWNFAQEGDQNAGVSHSVVFQDTVGFFPSSSRYKSPFSNIADQDLDTNGTYHNVFGNNMYNPNSVQKTGLRPVIIDGSNVAFGHGGKYFSTRGIEICVNYFVKRGHWVVAFVPLFRRNEVSDADRKILDELKNKNWLAFTPSRYLNGRRVTSYDDRFIVQCAAELGGVVVSTDNYRDLVCENEAWRETIEKRLLMFTWVGDLLMFPDDPNGRGGPRLEEFLRFPQ